MSGGLETRPLRVITLLYSLDQVDFEWFCLILDWTVLTQWFALFIRLGTLWVRHKYQVSMIFSESSILPLHSIQSRTCFFNNYSFRIILRYPYDISRGSGYKDTALWRLSNFLFIRSLTLLSFFLTKLAFGRWGFSCSGVIGRVVRSFHPISSSDGLYPFSICKHCQIWVTVLFQELLHSLDSSLCSTLACGYFGLLMIRLKPYSSANDLNSVAEYWGPLSNMTVSGIPWREKIDLRCDITLAAVVDVSFAT